MNTDETQISKMTLNQKLDWLIDQWCERRALLPLKLLLRAYPSILVHSDQIGDLLEALRDVKGLSRNELTPKELECVISVINESEDSLKRQIT
jgi:hypothetical protein